MPCEKTGKCLGTPNTHACGDVTRCPGCEALCQGLGSGVAGGTGGEAPPPDSAIVRPDQRRRRKPDGPSLSFKKKSHSAVWGFLMSRKKLREFQAFRLAGNRSGNGNRKWNGPLGTDWAHMGVPAPGGAPRGLHARRFHPETFSLLLLLRRTVPGEAPPPPPALVQTVALLLML